MDARQVCQDFANKHKLIFEDHGECGFGRPCVGFTKGQCYVAHNPLKANDNLDEIPELADERLYPGLVAPDAYHKHDCLAVLVHDDDYDKAIQQLAAWIQKLEGLGEVEVVQYATGATGFQAMITGLFGYAVHIK